MMRGKAAWQERMLRYLQPLLACVNASCTGVVLPGSGVTYRDDVVALEGLARPLWALGPFWHGGGRCSAWEQVYRRGIEAGVAPDSGDGWGQAGEYDQRFVEMAALACGLLLAPEQLWEPLAPAVRTHLAQWLEQINHHALPQCNWHFYRVLVNTALNSLGQPCRLDLVQDSLREIDGFYQGGGWYCDGQSSQRDYYAAFALHYYGLIYSRAAEKTDPERCCEFRRRAELFARQFIFWFDPSGASIPFGRSLTYRFAHVAFWSACLYADCSPFPVGIVKGLIERNLDYWDRQEMLLAGGVMSVGYAYPNLILAERYNSACSPYWAMKAFLVLALPDDHPFWQAEPEPLPALPELCAQPEGAALLQHSGGHAVLYAPGVCELYGHGHTPEKYAKFAYSSFFGFSVARSQLVVHENAPDSMLAFVPDGDDYVYVRKRSDRYRITDQAVDAEWSPLPGIRVSTTVMPVRGGHVRRHVIESDRPCTAYDCGFSVASFADGFHASAEGTRAEAGNARCICTVSGEGESASALVLDADPNTNVLYRNTVIPAVRYRIAPGRTTIETHVEARAFV
ncbi:MAG: DUF2264 domain-containing protein [Aristaeellaceae bacterium]